MTFWVIEACVRKAQLIRSQNITFSVKVRQSKQLLPHKELSCDTRQSSNSMVSPEGR
jgi:hypothetical protein